MNCFCVMQDMRFLTERGFVICYRNEAYVHLVKFYKRKGYLSKMCNWTKMLNYVFNI